MPLIRITRHHSTNVNLRINERPEVVIPVGPLFELDDVGQYTADEIRETLDNSHVEYEMVEDGSASATAGGAGGHDALSAVHDKPDDRVSATVSTAHDGQIESEDRKDALQPDAYGGELDGESNDTAGDSETREAENPDDGSDADESDENPGEGDERQPLDKAAREQLLDGNVDQITASLEGLSKKELRALRRDETNGRNRVGALNAIEKALNEGNE